MYVGKRCTANGAQPQFEECVSVHCGDDRHTGKGACLGAPPSFLAAILPVYRTRRLGQVNDDYRPAPE
jgi:hypothetical protein